MIWFRPCNLFPDRWEWNAISATFANAFEKDDKEPKRTARADDADGAGDQWTEFRLQACGDLLQLSSRANQARFHTSTQKEAGAPARDSDFSEAEMDGQPAPHLDLPAASDIVAKYVTALGGQTAIENISTRLEKGTVSFGSGPPLAVERITKSGKQIFTVHLPAGESRPRSMVAQDG